MGLVVLFLAFNTLLVGAYVHHHWRRARQANPPPLPRRLTDPELGSFAWRQAALVLIIAYNYMFGGWTPESVGLHGREHWLTSVLVGEFAFLGLALFYALVLRVTGMLNAMRETATHGNMRIWPRGRVQKWIAMVLFVGFNPFTEEFVMRGVLIHQWGLALGSPAVPIFVGFVLNGALHWYQGWRMQAWHALFFTMAVALLYSPFGLAAAITAHVLGDLLPIVHLRRNQKAARRARHAAMRAQRA